jgi:5-methylcytosine-specific restriction endonuclease McrA
MCEKSFNISTLEKYNGRCGRCSKTLIQHSKNELEISDETTESKNDKESSKRTKSSPKSSPNSSPNSSPEPYQKSPIPARLRQEVWEKNIGDKFWGNCFVCNIRLHVMEWSCGHIQSEFTGGKMVFENMKVLCKSCNSKMGTENLLEYKARKYPEVVKEIAKEDVTKQEVVKQEVVKQEVVTKSIFSRCFCL